MKIISLLFICLFLSLNIHSEEQGQEKIQCYPYATEYAQKQNLTFSEEVNAYFGDYVNSMAQVLFYQVGAFKVEIEEGKAQVYVADLQNSFGNDLWIKVISQEKQLEPGEIQIAYCLDKLGNIQSQKSYSEDFQRVWFTRWTLQQGQFVYEKPFLQQLEAGESLSAATVKLSQANYITTGMPLIVLLLLSGGLFYTIYHRFINFRLFGHAIACVRGVYDNPKDPGEISHFQALTSALSATVGLGNIAGVAIAIALGGPGAVMWMMLLGFLGMSSKFHECTLGQMYRRIDDQGRVHGGPKYYLSQGLSELGWPRLGKILAFVFALFCIGGALGAGNMFQANQSFALLNYELKAVGWLAADNNSFQWFFAFGMVLLVAAVILGGMKRIGQVTSKLIPLMAGIYLLAALYIIFSNFDQIDDVLKLIVGSAFSFEAGLGGFVGVLVVGVKRAVFSNEAGIGSAAIAHSAAKTDEPVREGIVALLEPFIDTVVICFVSAFVIISTGVYTEGPIATDGSGLNQGVVLMRQAFAQEISWFPTVLTISVFFFAYSTMISWSYYGEKAWTYLFGFHQASTVSYRVIFLVFIVLGTISSLSNVIGFSDLMILSMAFPNIIGGFFLARKVKAALTDYLQRLHAGKMQRFK